MMINFYRFEGRRLFSEDRLGDKAQSAFLLRKFVIEIGNLALQQRHLVAKFG